MSLACDKNALCRASAVVMALMGSVVPVSAEIMFTDTIPGFITDAPYGPRTYQIIATGASGGGGWFGNSGGRGAVVSGTFTFTTKWTLSLLVGGRGGDSSDGGGGGGGATFVFGSGGTLLLIAGGGGGDCCFYGGNGTGPATTGGNGGVAVIPMGALAGALAAVA